MTISKAHLKRKLFEIMEDPKYRPLKRQALADAIGIHRREGKTFRSLLRSLEKEGVVVQLRNYTYALPREEVFVTGTLSVHLNGFGFVARDDDTEGDDIFIPRSGMNGARHGDEVRVTVNEENERGPDGVVVEILERGVTTSVGTLMRRGKSWLVLPDDPRVGRSIRVKSFENGIKPAKNHKVALTLHEALKRGAAPTAVVTEDFGPAGAAGVDMMSIMHRYGLSEKFPKKVATQIERIKAGLSNKVLAERKDLRSWLIYTIDPASAKDHDDALSLRKNKEGNWELGVHIADVAHYVKPDSALDEEAIKRGNSTYLVDRVVPMLPNKLTTDLCSLVPYKDRLTHTVLIELSPRGKMLGYDTFPSVIHSKAKISYTQVQDFFDEGITKGITKKIQVNLLDLQKLTRAVRKRRMGAGAINFHVPEVRCELRKDGTIKKIVKRMPIEAYALVEECMLLANKAVAQIFVAKDVPGIFRIHEEPSEDQWAQMIESLAAIGIDQVPETRDDLNQIVKEQEKLGLQHPVVISILRNLNRAMYSERLAEHFGLAFDEYSHFTSPIRRYPDLIAHRILKAIEKNEALPYKKKAIEQLALHCSQTEQNSEEAEIESVQVKLIAHYEKRLWSGDADVYDARITSLKNRGLIVELEESMMRGMVPYASLSGDYFEVDDSRTRAIGKRTRETFKLGDTMQVMIVRVDSQARQIEFGPV